MLHPGVGGAGGAAGVVGGVTEVAMTRLQLEVREKSNRAYRWEQPLAKDAKRPRVNRD